jgi:hypothetical protein
MDDHTRELSALAGTAKQKAPQPAPMPIYDFEHLGETLSDSLVQTSEALLTEAQRISDDLLTDARRLANDARTLAADIRMQVAEQSKLLADINIRMRAAGEQMLEAQRRFNGS